MPKIKGLDSFSEVKDHIYDDYKNLGYDYRRRGILNKVLSPECFANSLADPCYRCIELLIINLIEAVQKITLHYAITFPKNSKLIN